MDPNLLIKKISTSLQWIDLLLNDEILKNLDEIRLYLKHSKNLVKNWNFRKKIKPGFRVIFTGPARAEKEIATVLLGKEFKMDVYKVDLSQLVSKYIGETEKNLSSVFDLAEGKDWILFFDEADALFGRRTQVKDAHDRYSNQESSFLLQRIEQYQGIVILSANFKNTIDDAFLRRLEMIIDFNC